MANGHEILARLPRSAAERPAESSMVWVNWRREHATLFPFEQMATRTQAIQRHKSLE
jgi:hypothetical protein